MSVSFPSLALPWDPVEGKRARKGVGRAGFPVRRRLVLPQESDEVGRDTEVLGGPSRYGMSHLYSP